MNIILATGNENKKKEYLEMVKKDHIHFLTAKECHLDMHVEENQSTYRGNALLKARHLKKQTQKIVMADDSGICIDALPHILNVHTARYMEGHTYLEKCQSILELMKGCIHRNARFICCICLILENNETYFFEGTCEGKIADQMEGNQGFGYDPIFIPNGYDCSFASLEKQIKNQISHRGLAFQQMYRFLLEKGYID